MKLELGSPPESGDLYNAFINALVLAGAGNGTIKLYSTAVKDFLDFINKDPRKVTSEDLNKWISNLLNREGKVKGDDVEKRRAKSVTIRYYIIAVRRFLKWLNVSVKPPIPKVRRKEVKALDESQIQKVLNTCKRTKDKLIIRLLLDTGLRANELLSVLVKDVDLENNMIRVRNTKNGEERVVFFTDETKQLLRKYMKGKKLDEKLFDITYDALYRKLKRLGNKVEIELRPHILRHTFATLSLKRGINVITLQKLLGHKDIKTTQIYTHLVLDDLRNEYLKAMSSSSSKTPL
ncbi:site-specific tyrosine recombinase/integron integrase [Saccharolobus islandicus]|uniref:Tyrosine recombinase XerA n=3 Tax=Saccharolobus islandicus TaxID=43080 RepID=C4KIG5_SACI6|nr:site-specific tyrosine recombinase/integron integrase [Sulfolobus islandicus]ACP38475.1 integrase family protein [Sulfolobus islandicus M.14.25]ACP55719.1 integrase family protein [Sulfolobus islandicus M.16.27]ACR42379.1 integrase family protein [Sulfolobus islandicus M.16.4]